MLKKKSWKRVICGILAVISLLSISGTEVKAEEYWPEGPSITSQSAIVIELNSGAVLYENNSEEINYPASITKVMTVMLALEYCELDEIVTFSADAVYKNEGNTSHIARDLNEEMTMEECLYAVMLESANECAYAVAEHVGAKLGGDYQTFIDLMNQRAEELGCTNTHFNNANGLPDTEHWTWARDLALISAEAYKNENYRIIIGSRRYVIPPTNKHSEKTYLNNHHWMIHDYLTADHLYEYCTGGKTGFTQAAGATLVSYAEKDGVSLVCVIMRSSSPQHYIDTRALFEYCFQNFSTYNIGENEKAIIQNDRNKGFMNLAGSFITIDENAYITLPVTASFSDAKLSYEEGNNKDGMIGSLVYTYGDRVVGSTNIVASGVSVGETYFTMNSSSTDTEKTIIKIKPTTIILVVLLVIIIVLAIFFGKKLYDNFYVILHNMETKRQQRERFRPIEKKRRRRRRNDRMFR